jgi:DNA-directed RNA polymerase subunit RPC12/RpoP
MEKEAQTTELKYECQSCGKEIKIKKVKGAASNAPLHCNKPAFFRGVITQ